MREIRPRRVDLRLLRLTAEEGFVLSRLTGPTTLRELVAVSNLEEPRVVEIVRRLVDQGAVEVEGDLPPLRAPAPSFAGIDELDELGAVLEVAAVTDAGRVRTDNEDSFVTLVLSTGVAVDEGHAQLDEQGVLLAVADGMGGAKAGEVASIVVVETLRESLVRRDPKRDAADVLCEAAENANARVVEASVERGCEGMGATLVAVLVCEGAAYTAEIGDSRFYVLRGGSLVQISKDQTYTAALVAKGVMTPEDARSSQARHVVLQACGKGRDIIVAQRRVVLGPGDVLLLCSDGLSGEVDDPTIASILVDMSSPRDACAKLLAKALENGGHDNATIIVARVGGHASDDGEGIAVTTLRAFELGD
jgi:serine/threonine protein phosphatase PrpC